MLKGIFLNGDLGISYFMDKHIEKKNKEKQALAANNRGVKAHNSGNNLEALEYFNEALALCPNNATILENRDSAMNGLRRDQARKSDYKPAQPTPSFQYFSPPPIYSPPGQPIYQSAPPTLGRRTIADKDATTAREGSVSKDNLAQFPLSSPNNKVTPAPEKLAADLGHMQISLIIPYKEVSFAERLGEGSYGVVFKGTWQHTEVAIKQLKLAEPSQEATDEFQREVKVMVQLNHPHIIHLYGVCTDQIPPCMVMEYMPRGSLYHVLGSKLPLDAKQRQQIALDIARGLAFLHSKNILHRDLKSLNVLLDKDFHAKLCDFGLSKIKLESSSTSSRHQKVGTTRWMAPEIFDEQPYTAKADIYSYGVTLWEISSRRIPFPDKPEPVVMKMVWLEKKREPIPADCPAKIAHLIRFCWEHDPAKRFTANQVVEQLTKDSASVTTTTVTTTTASLDYEGNFASQSSSRGKTGSHR
jgi:predicted Ser/Thr protein kinase